jgi:hypothetical protein
LSRLPVRLALGDRGNAGPEDDRPRACEAGGGPWIIPELFGAFLRGVLSHAFGDELVQHIRMKHHGARTWRLERMLTTGVVLLEVIPASDGSRLPDENVAAVERNAQWLYRARVLGDSINSITTRAGKEGIDVRKGIKETDRLLSLTAYAWGEGK